MELSRVKRAHFIAIGGAGMSGIAWVFLKRGIAVSGSDLVSNWMTQRLAEHGAQCYVGHDPAHLNAADVVVVSSAIGEENCELTEARRRALPIWHRSEALAAILTDSRSIGIAGCHGKTTATAMVGLIFEHAGLDPTIVVGGESANLGGTAKAGSSNWAIAELDESDGSFLRFAPHYALITNIEADHLDHYGTFESILAAFKKFASQVAHAPVVCWDDPGVRMLLGGQLSSAIRYAVSSDDAEYCATDISATAHGSRFTVTAHGREIGEVNLPAAGTHNVSNALGAIAVAIEAGLDPAVCCRALADFRGVARRLTIQGEWGGVLLVDDYAHHPTEISAALQVGRRLANERGGRLICVFQPHRFTRTAALARQFGPAFAAADRVIVTAIYAASEQAIKGVTGAMIAESIREAGHRDVQYNADMNEIGGSLPYEVKRCDVVMTIGAGNVWKVADQLRDRLEDRVAPAAVARSDCVQTPVEGHAPA